MRQGKRLMRTLVLLVYLVRNTGVPTYETSSIYQPCQPNTIQQNNQYCLPIPQNTPLTQQNTQVYTQQAPVFTTPSTSIYTPTIYTQQKETNTKKQYIDKKLSSLLTENPTAKSQLMTFLEYSGVPPPWDPLFDFETTQHHQLPDPDVVFGKIRKQLLSFDRIKTCIVEALMVVEKFIHRAKAYLAEDLRDLCQNRTILKNILKRLKTKPAQEFRSELFERYTKVIAKICQTKGSFYKMRKWLNKVKELSKKL